MQPRATRPTGLAVALVAAFVAIELRSQSPLVPFRIFRIRTLTGANVVGILLGASLFSMFFFISLYMQQVLGYSPIHAGLSYLPLAVTIFIAAGFGGQLVSTGTHLPNALNEGFQSAFRGGAVIAALGFVATLILIRTRDSRARLEQANSEAAPAHA